MKGLAALAAAGLVLAAASAAAGAAPSGLTLAVDPTRLLLVGHAKGVFNLRNPTDRQITVKASTADFVLRPSGAVIVGPKQPPVRSARSWLKVSPATLQLAPHSSATVRVSSDPVRHASPGDHHALVFFRTVPSGNGVVRTRTQIGLPVLVRVAGKVVRKLTVGSLRVLHGKRREALRLTLRNRGNIDERLPHGSVTIALRRHGRTLSRLSTRIRSILPGGRARMVFGVAARIRGHVVAVVRIKPGSPAAEGAFAPPSRPIKKAFRIRL